MDDLGLSTIARAAAAGDAEAFAGIVRATQTDVLRLCAALGDAAHADDLAQETYLRAFRALPTYAGEAPVRAWLLGIARHVCVDDIRRRERRRSLLRRLPPRPDVVHPGRRTELELLVGALPVDQREAFVLTQVVGLSYAEAGEVAGCPVGTIRSRVARARAALIAQLDDAREEAR